MGWFGELWRRLLYLFQRNKMAKDLADEIHPNQALKENVRGTIAGTSRFNPGKAPVSFQVALSLVLLVAAGLFLGTLRNLLATDVGFNAHKILLVSASVPKAKFPSAPRLPLFARILERLREVPAIRSASSSSGTPIQRWFWNEETYPEGYTPKSEDDALVYFNRVSPGYFETMQIPRLVGRDFSDRDNLTAPKVMIISESTAREFLIPNLMPKYSMRSGRTSKNIAGVKVRR
jgi:putative ABC transport system permease protein